MRKRRNSQRFQFDKASVVKVDRVRWWLGLGSEVSGLDNSSVCRTSGSNSCHLKELWHLLEHFLLRDSANVVVRSLRRKARMHMWRRCWNDNVHCKCMGRSRNECAFGDREGMR